MWRAELGNFDYDVKHLPGKSNLAPDTLSRACSIIPLAEDLPQLHSKLEHPGFSRLFHFYVPKIYPFRQKTKKRFAQIAKFAQS